MSNKNERQCKQFQRLLNAHIEGADVSFEGLFYLANWHKIPGALQYWIMGHISDPYSKPAILLKDEWQGLHQMAYDYLHNGLLARDPQEYVWKYSKKDMKSEEVKISFQVFDRTLLFND